MTSLTQLMATSREDLQAIATERGVSLRPHLQHDELVAEIVTDLLAANEEVTADGVFTLLPDGFGFVRILGYSLAATAADAYVSQGQVRSLNLQSGHRIRGPVRAPRSSERFFALTHVDAIQGVAPEERQLVTVFEARTPIVARQELPWCADDEDAHLLRALQVLAPIRLGHRVLMHTPSGWARTATLTQIARSLRRQHADLDITICALDQRPEDIASMRADLADQRCDLVSTSFAERPERSVAVADLAAQCAMRQVECGRDAILIIDSLTALTRASSRSAPPSGAWIQPGLDAAAVLTAKRLFAKARLCAEGGSLTILATIAQGEQGSLDDAIEREFSCSTNSDIVIAQPDELDGEEVLLFDPVATKTRPEDDPTPRPKRSLVARARRELAALPRDQRTTALLGI